jgi:hypothetical protein
LEPIVSSKEYIVYPGKKQLLRFDVVYSDVENYHYDLIVYEEIGDTTLATAYDFPYVLPVKKYSVDSQDVTTYSSDLFKVDEFDTIYCMRRGIITCTPNQMNGIDKISSNSSLEVLHKDGTVMVYDGVGSSSVLFNIGDLVFPGLPILVSKSAQKLDVRLYEILPEEKLSRIPIRYYNNINNTYEYVELMKIVDELSARIPEAIITREMTEKELRNYLQ